MPDGAEMSMPQGAVSVDWRPAGVVFACAVGNFVSATPMINSLFGMFLVPIAESLHWPRSMVSLSLVLVSVAGVAAYPVAGHLADRVGVRPVALVGNVLFAAAFFCLSFLSANPLQFYGLFLLLGLTAALPSTVLYAKLITNWFVIRRGLFLGLTAGGGNGGGSTVMPMLAAPLLVSLGWRGAYQALAGVILFVGFPILFLLLRDPPEGRAPSRAVDPAPDHLQGADFGQARRTTTFKIMLGAIGLGAGSLTAIFAHVIPMLMDRGFSLNLATTVLVSFALTCTAWQLAMGWVLDRLPTPKIAAAFFIIAVPGLLLVSYAHTPALLIVGGMLIGVGLGTEYCLLPYWTARYFGRRAYGAIYGAIFGAVALIMGVTPVLMDLIYDHTGSYNLAVNLVAVALLGGAALVCVLKPYTYDRAGVPVATPANQA